MQSQALADRKDGNSEDLPTTPMRPSPLGNGGVPKVDPDVQRHLDDIQKLVEKEFGGALHSDLRIRIKKETMDLHKKIMLLQNTNVLIGKLSAEIAELKKGQLPASCKKVNIAFESDLLDRAQVVVPCRFGVEPSDPIAEDKRPIIIEEPCSIRDAKERVHLWYLITMKDMDAQLCNARGEDLRQFTRITAFVSRCMVSYKVAPVDALDLILEDDITIPSNFQMGADDLRSCSSEEQPGHRCQEGH